ncbi:hypothetical protein SAMN02745229_00172 [Butyrivibrio fibrisolvens DSM 3071]|uniref:Uncharacterized protein n=1 Tax=Butyrivibrio fibrisolvens DSM 3071 TaxID=1121131 RepID=A0A1M5Q2B4_BUTFI|nr:hypothetical protein [Butyrivibrio fibrisolvens]SHH08080.1 hypothetical protein SAMN02745229_00172 [Butyrivibrio fibrisolvens DSM 3071]
MRSKLFGRLMSFTLSATVALTSGIPSLAYDGGGGDLPEEEEEILVLDDEDEELGSNFDAEESIVEDEISFEEENEEDAEFESIAGVNLTVTNAQSDVKLYTCANGTPTELVTGNITSDQDFVFYVVPEVGKALKDAPVTITGTYDNNGTLVPISSSDYTVSDVLEEYDITGDSGNLVAQSALAATKFYWNNAKMVTIKKSYLSNYEKYYNKPSAATGEVALTVTAAASDGAVKFSLPIFVYDDINVAGSETYQTYSQAIGMSSPQITYGLPYGDNTTDYILIGNAIDDWDDFTYTPKLALVKKDLSGETALATTLTSDWNADVANATADKHQYVANGHKFGLTATATKNAYIETEKSEGTKFAAIVLVKTAKTASYILSAKDTNFVDWSFTDGSGNAIDSQKIEAANFNAKEIGKVAASGNDKIGVVAKGYGAPANAEVLPGGGTPDRTLAQATGSVKYALGTADPADATWDSTGSVWKLPNSAANNVVLTAVTQEQVTFKTKTAALKNSVVVKYVKKNGAANTTAIDVTANSGAGTTDTVNSESSIQFSVYPKEGYTLKGVYLTKYTADGTKVTHEDAKLTGTDNVYTVEDISGYARIVIDAEEVTNKIGVRLDAASSANVTITDLKTNVAPTTTAADYAIKNEDYYFTALVGDGYLIDEMTAKAGTAPNIIDAAVSLVKFDKTTKLYTYKVAGVSEGPITLKAKDKAALTIYKVANSDATVTIGGEILDDGDKTTIDVSVNNTLNVTANNGAKVTGIYYGTAGNTATQAAMDTLVTAGTAAWKVSAVPFAFSSVELKELAGAGGNSIYVYATTTREAIEGKDYYSIKFVDADGTDISSGLTMWAGDGSAATIRALAGSSDDDFRTVSAIWLAKDGTTPVYTSPASSTDSTDVVKYSLAKTTVPADLDKQVATLTNNVITPTKYNGGSASSDSDVLSVEYNVTDSVSGATTKFPANVVFKASLPITVKPVRDFYETYDFAVTGTLYGEKKIRVNGTGVADSAVFTPMGHIAATKTAAAVNASLASGTSPVAATSAIKFTTTPAMNILASSAEYTLNADTINEVTADAATIAAAKKAQNIDVSAEVKFVDGTTRTITDTLEVVATDYGYYAIPTVTVNGTKTTVYSGTTSPVTMNIETLSGGINNGTIKFDVYHALTNAGSAHFTTYDLANEDDIANAIEDGDIEAVPASDITWTSLEGAVGFEKYFTVSGNSGEFTITAKSKTAAAEALTLDAEGKVNGYDVNLPTGKALNVNVSQKLARYNFAVTTNDTSGSADYLYPVLSWDLGYTRSDVLTGTNVSGTTYLNVPLGTTFKLPGAEVFSGVNPKRTLAGWKDEGNTYHLIGSDFTTTATSTLTAVWAYKYSSTTGNVLYASAGNILAVNTTTEAAVANPLNIAKEGSVSVIAGYYPLDLETLCTGTTAPYGATLETIKDTSKLKLVATDATSGKNFLGADDEGVFANATINGVKKTSSSLSAKLTYTEAEGISYEATISQINVTDSEIWQIEAEDVTLENFQTTNKPLKTIKKGTSDEDLANTTLAGQTVTFTYSDDTIATVVLNADNQSLGITAKAVGSTDVTMTMISTNNIKKVVTFNVTVTKAKVNIGVKVTPNYGATANKTPVATTVAEGEPLKLWVDNTTGNTIDITFTDEAGAEIQASSVTSCTVTFPTAPAGTTYVTIAKTDVSAVEKTFKINNVDGIAKVTITAVISGKTYVRTLDAVTYRTIQLYGPAAGNIDISNTTTPDNKAENTLFEVYEGTQVDDNKFAVGKVAFVPVVYDATKKAADKYSVSLSDYSVKWISDDLDQEFLGWGATAAAIKQTEADYTGTVEATLAELKTGISLYPYFKSLSIKKVEGIPEVIRLTDEKVGAKNAYGTETDIAAANTRTTHDGTNWEEYELFVDPSSSAEKISIKADKAGFYDIASVGQTDTPTTYGKTTDAEVLYLDTTATAPWSGKKLFVLGVGGNAAQRIDNFRIGKIKGKVGAAKIYIIAGSSSYGPIDLYVNGEYVDGTKTRYMEDGEVLEEGMKTVLNVAHFYKGKERVTKGIIKVKDGDAEKLILVDSNTWIKKPSNTTRVLDDKTYFIGEDGYLKTGVVTIDGKDYLFREDGSKVSHTDEDVKDGIFTFGDVDYVVADDDTVEEDKLFEVSGTPTWTWTKASDGKTFASAKVVFTSTDGRTKEITVPVAKMTVTTEGELTKYVAAASFKSKGTEISATDTKYLDAEGNEVIPHDHVWTPEWKWTDVEGDVEKKTVALTLTCKVDAENPHTESFSKTVTAEKNGLVWSWNASFEYDEKTYTAPEQKEVRDEQTGEEIEVEDISGGKGIVITLYRDEYNYTGSPIKPTDFSVLDLERDSDYYLNPGTEYSVSYKNNTKVGEAEIIIKGKGNYAGKATSAKFKIVNPYPDDVEAPVVKGATLKLPKATYTFNNEEQFPATVEFGLKGETAKTYTFDRDAWNYFDAEGNTIPAAWTCENNRNAGTATFAVLGVKDSKGQPTAVKKTFKIQAAALDTTNFKVLVGSQEKDFEIEWFAKGATPWVDIVWANGDNEYGLWIGKDFAVSYKDNKKAGTASVSIKGKGNFKGTLKNVATFKINALDLSETWLQAVTLKAGNKGKQVKVTVVDHHDNIIPANKYTVSVKDASTGADLTNTKLTAGMEILVKAVAKDSTAVTGETIERPVTVAADFSKATVKVAKGFYKEYTGQAIELTDEDMKNITVTIKVGKDKKTLVYGEDFFIAGTADNVNKGTMTVTIEGNPEGDTERGIPAFSGSKTFKVKIKARQLPLK